MILDATAAAVGSDARHRVIVVDDDDAVRRSLQLMLHWRGFDVRTFAGATPVLDDRHAIEAAAIVVDQQLPDGDGVSLLAALRVGLARPRRDDHRVSLDRPQRGCAPARVRQGARKAVARGRADGRARRAAGRPGILRFDCPADADLKMPAAV